MGADFVGVQTVELGNGAAGQLELVYHRRQRSVVTPEQQCLDSILLSESMHDRDTDFGAATEHQDP